MKEPAKDPYGAIRNGQGKGIPKAKLPLGTIVIRKSNHGNLVRMVKIRMGGPSGSRFIQYSRWWWERNKGPVPQGHLVLHGDGDEMNDDPKNLILGTPGTKLVIAHKKDLKWSKEQHRRAAAACGDWNRKMGRINRTENFLKTCWYPVVDAMGVIFNIPFRKRKWLLGSFGTDVSRYPANGGGKKPDSIVQRTLRHARVQPVKSADLALRRYSTYCLVDPVTKDFRGPLPSSIPQLIAQLERMEIWQPAEKLAKKDFRERIWRKKAWTS
jgi:hypothetical protein